MKPLKYFFLGIISVIVAIPILESVAEISCMLLEIPKGLLSEKVMIINKRLTVLQEESEPVNTVAVGFAYNKDDEEYYEED